MFIRLVIYYGHLLSCFALEMKTCGGKETMKPTSFGSWFGRGDAHTCQGKYSQNILLTNILFLTTLPQLPMFQGCPNIFVWKHLPFVLASHCDSESIPGKLMNSMRNGAKSNSNICLIIVLEDLSCISKSQGAKKCFSKSYFSASKCNPGANVVSDCYHSPRVFWGFSLMPIILVRTSCSYSPVTGF